MREYLTPIVESRKAHPGDDLVSDIVTAEIDGERLSDEHIYGFLRLLLPAGAETTFRAFGTCLLALLSHPDVLTRVRHDHSLLDAVIEETLRWETSVTMVNRETACGVDLGGVTLPAGASVVCATGSANHDETRYDDGDTWDLDRPAVAHLAFGTGRHQCLGMHLARLELRVGLAAVLDRLPGLRLDPAAPEPRIEGLAFRSPPAPRRPLRLVGSGCADGSGEADETEDRHRGRREHPLDAPPAGRPGQHRQPARLLGGPHRHRPVNAAPHAGRGQAHRLAARHRHGGHRHHRPEPRPSTAPTS